jgi:proline racemase
MLEVKTIDAHVGGTPVRIVVDGFPSARGASMSAKAEWAQRRADAVRRLLMLEPRGHQDMRGAVLTEPVSAHAHAGVLTMNAERFGELSLSGVLAATLIAMEQRLLVTDGAAIVDTVCGPLTIERLSTATAELRGGVGDVPATVMQGGVALKLHDRSLRADLVRVGEVMAIVDGESAGVALDLSYAPELRRTARDVTRALDPCLAALPADLSIASVVFTSPARTEAAAMRLVRVTAHGVVGRSASGSGSVAVLAVLDAMGLVDGEAVTFEGLSGETVHARIVRRTMNGDATSIFARWEASAWITGHHIFIAADDDRLSEGFLTEMG